MDVGNGGLNLVSAGDLLAEVVVHWVCAQI